MTTEEIAIVVKECIEIIQRKIVRNGDTPENIRSRQHVKDIKEKFGLEQLSILN